MLRIAAQKCELRAVIGEGIDLAMIELDRTDGLRRRINCLCFGAQAAKGGLLFVRADPGCDRGRRDGAAGFGLQALGGLIERVAKVIERERLQHQADGIGLVAKRGRARREQALAGAAAPELDDLEFLLAQPLRVMTWLPQCGHAPGGLFVCGAVAGRRRERDITWGVGRAYHRSRILEG